MSEIPKRPDEEDRVYIYKRIDHEHAVAKIAVEALRDAITKQRTNRLYSASNEMEDALVKIMASGWKP